MNIIADTNILVRAIQNDHPEQSQIAKAELSKASLIAIPVTVFCELSWVLKSRYRIPGSGIAAAIRALLATPAVQTDREAALAGLALLDAGGGFADGVVASQGQRLGGEVFLSFDEQAVKLLSAAGQAARIPVLSDS